MNFAPGQETRGDLEFYYFEVFYFLTTLDFYLNALKKGEGSALPFIHSGAQPRSDHTSSDIINFPVFPIPGETFG